ncbi:MAG: hypothetical protein RR136_01515, partial [Clostridia bacterium]
MKDSDVLKFEIQKGALVYIKDKCTANEIKWLTDVGLKEKVLSPIIYTTNKSESKYNLPYMPTGFNYLEGTYETGLVIKDNNNGNEFVWIPVANFSNFNRVEYNKGVTVAQCIEDKAQPELSAIYTSVQKYGGYYIARYEAGLPNTTSPATSNHNTVCDGTIKPVSKPGVSPWNYIPWGANNNIANPGNGAVTVARSMYKT